MLEQLNIKTHFLPSYNFFFHSGYLETVSVEISIFDFIMKEYFSNSEKDSFELFLK